MHKFKRILAGILSATMIMSSMSMGVLADELNTENETVYESVVDEQESVMATTEAVSETITEITSEDTTETEETATESESETSIEETSVTETVTEELELAGAEAEDNYLIDYHVADAYAFEYSDEDIREAIEAAYSPEELLPDDGVLELQEVLDSSQIVDLLRGKLRDRVENVSFETDGPIDYNSCIAKAYNEDLSRSPKEGDYIRANYIGYYMSCRYGAGNYAYSFTFTYTSNTAQEAEVDREVARLVNKLGLKSASKSQYDKIRDIHDYLVNNIRYYNDKTYGCHGTYSALLKGYCVCQGYAATFHRLCREAGINSRYIVGDKINHAWNIVRVNDNGNDEWYNMDVTWDDPLPDGQYTTANFMKNDVEFTGHPRNDEFRTKTFEKAHPMAMYSWGKSSTGIYKSNLSYTFRSIDGEMLDTHADVENKKPKLLIFYGDDCTNSQNSIKSISTCLPVKYDRIDVYAIDCDNETDALVRRFATTYDPERKIKFSSGGLTAASAYLRLNSGYSSKLPVMAFIDENDIVRFVTNGAVLGDDLNIMFMRYLSEGWNPYASALKGIAFNKTAIKLGMSKKSADEEQLTVIYNPDDCINQKESTFTSSDEGVATVDKNGLVKAVGAGVATITATSYGFKATCKVTVFNYVDDITIKDNANDDLSNKTRKMYSGGSVELNLVTVPTNASVMGEIKWSSSDADLLSITKKEEGYTVIATAKAGITEIRNVTVTADVDGATAKCILRIIPSQVKLNANGGTINGRTYEYMNVIPGMPFGEMPLPDNREGYVFAGWKTSTSAGEGTYITEKTIAGDCWEIFAIWKQVAVEQMWARELGDYQYTGSVIKPQVKVYDGNILLVEGVDYSVVYKNNKNVYQYKEGDEDFLNTKAPCAIVKGKKNYTGSLTVYFTISPKRITDSDVTVLTETLVKTETAKAQYPVPTIKWGKLGLRNKTDFTLTYPDNVDENSYKKPGLYRITINGNGNYTGERTVNMRITDKNAISIKRAVVKNLKNYEFTGSEIKQVTTGDKPFGLYFGGKPLTENVDYYLEYVEGTNINIGTAKINVIGIGDYTGIKPLTFKITGKSIATAVINSEALQPVSYTGQYIEPKVVLTDKKAGKDLVEGTDYLVTYDKNKDVGSAIIKITGINGYTGTLTKRFRINAYKMPDENDENIKVTYDGEVVYRKSGAKPAVAVSYKSIKADGSAEWQPLTEGTDYTLRYTNNAKVYEYGPSDEGFYEKNGKTKSPVVTITLKKNFAGKIAKYYKITPGSLNNQATIFVPDITYIDKPLKWKSKPVVTDVDGKKLVVKTDYSADVIYTYAANATMADGTTRTVNAVVGDDDIPMPGTVINVTVTGVGNYSSSTVDRLAYNSYKILAADRDIGKGITFTVADKYYNGSGMNPDTGIVISKSDITFKLDAKHSEFTDDNYEIVPGSYTKNRFIGVASVTLRGINGYGGTKVVKFRIKSKSII